MAQVDNHHSHFVEAPVKAEFVIKRTPIEQHKVEAVTKESVDENDRPSESTDKDKPPPSKRSKKNRGQNKNRNFFTVQHTKKPCPNLYGTVPCSYAECKNLHSFNELNQYLDSKLPDISETCPVYERNGYCSTGLACRFGNAHLDGVINICKHGCVTQPINDDNVNKTADTPSCVVENSTNTLSEAAALHSDALIGHQCIAKTSAQFRNITPRPILQDLRKQKIPFPRTADYMEILKKEKAKIDLNTEKYFLLEGEEHKDVKLRIEEIKPIDFRDKLYLAPLTTLGNLPYRRVCKMLGADITCGEMALADDVIKGGFSEHALLRRHESEDVFGIQLCAPNVDQIVKAAELLGNGESYAVDFVDLNMGCPIDLIYQKGGGSALIAHPRRAIDMVNGVMYASGLPCTVKMRTGVKQDHNIAHKLIVRLKNETKVNLITLHGRSREQRYTKLADWDYINECAKSVDPLPVFGNGDCFSFTDYDHVKTNYPLISGVMLARGALIKPWVFTEIKERRHWDISSSERLDILRNFVHSGLEHWGSDDVGVEKTRKFLLEWLSFLCRYIPVGLLEVLPQKLNERPPSYYGRNDLETLMASNDCNDWVKITEMLLGPVPEGYFFVPKHKANSFASVS